MKQNNNWEDLEVAKDSTGWYHKDPDGKPAYKQRYKEVSTFSEGLAVAMDDEGWFHIKSDGSPAYETRFRLVGGFFGGITRAVDFDYNGFFINAIGVQVDLSEEE
jgi:hypothetical protein